MLQLVSITLASFDIDHICDKIDIYFTIYSMKDSSFKEAFNTEEITEEKPSTPRRHRETNPIIIPLSVVLGCAIIAGSIIYNGHVATNAASGDSSTSTSTDSTEPATMAAEVTKVEALAANINGLNTSKFNSCYSGNKHTSDIATDVNQGTAINVSGTPTVIIGKINSGGATLTGYEVYGAYPFSTFQPILDNFVEGKSSYTSTDTTAVSATPVTISLSDTNRQGNSKSDIAFVEFGDFQCPYCGQLYQNVIPQLLSQYVNNGKVQYIFEDFPLTTIHQYAQDRAIAARCAEDQGKFCGYV